MNKARFTTGLVLLILLFSLVHWPQATAITPQDQTISIANTQDDKFITETGIGIDSQLCHILDTTMDIRSYLVFRGVEINFWEPLKNATLRFRTTANLDFDANSTVTVYGMKYSDLQLEGILNPGWVLSVPLTSASVTVNTSQFYGQTWHEVNVTTIVEELIRSYDWNGDGSDGTETGDSIGFIILGAQGYDTRWFIDYLYGTPSLAPQIVIHWNHEPPPPSESPEAVYNETYRGYHIFYHLGHLTFINHSQWDIHTVAGGTVNRYNTTGIQAIGIDGNSDVVRMEKTQASSPLGENGSVLMKVLVDSMINAGVGTTEIGPEYLGFMNSNNSISGNNGAPGNEIFGFGYRENPDNQTDDIFMWSIYMKNNAGGGVGTANSPAINTPVDPRWLILSWDFSAQWANMLVYSDQARTNLEYNLTRGPASPFMIAGGYNYHFVFNTYSIGIDAGVWSNVTYTSIDSGSPQDETIWFVTDENGTTITDDCTSYECALISIEDELGADPQDPEPPGEEWTTGPGGETGAFTRFRMRLWFMLIGFGCLFGPLLFFAWRRPSGYYIICGAIVMLIGIGLLLSIGQV